MLAAQNLLRAPEERNTMTDEFSAEQAEQPVDDWRARFPNMTPIKGPPSMMTINSLGTKLWGRRDGDPETGSYVSTLCFVILFLPVLPIRAYRIIDAPNGGYYFLGREPLSPFARTWNWLVFGFIGFLVLVGMIGAWLSSPEMRASRLLSDSRSAQAEGNSPLAWNKGCQALALNVKSDEARELLQGLYKNELSKFNLQELLAILEDPILHPRAIANDEAWVKLGWDIVQSQKSQASAELLRRIRVASSKLDMDRALWLEAAEKALREVLSAKPGAEIATELAFVLEERRDADAIKAVLEPYRAQLGTSEGARILGLNALAARRNDEALALLEPYLQKNLSRLKNADQELQKVSESVWAAELARLRSGKGPRELFRKELDEETRSEMVQNHLLAHLNSSPQVLQARETLKEASALAPLSLQLGLLYMERGQDSNRPEAARRKDMESAESTLLSIEGVASSSSEFQLSLGQVTSWLGKTQASDAAFQKFLELEGESASAMLQLSECLRVLGSTERARALAQEAYEKAENDPETKTSAAYLCSVLHNDREEKIRWLERSDTKAPQIQAALAEARAQKANETGDQQTALQELRRAAAIYETAPPSAAVINNYAIVLIQIYNLTHQRSDLVSAVKTYEKALELAPTNGILVWNVANAELQLGFYELLEAEIPFEDLEMDARFDSLSYLFKDETGRALWLARLQAQPRLKKARELLERARALMPSNPGPASTIADILSFARDEVALQDLAERLKAAPIDHSEGWRAAIIGYDGPEASTLEATARMINAQAKVLARQKDGSRALAIAKNRRAMLLFFDWQLDPRKALTEALSLAREAHALEPSQATLSAIELILCASAINALSQSDETLGPWLLANRHLNPVARLFYMLQHRPSLREPALACAFIPEALSIMESELQSFPESANIWSWSLLDELGHKSAEVFAERIRKSKRLELTQTVEDWLYPMNLMNVLERDRLDRCLNQRKPERLQQAKKQGLPIPDEAQR